MADCTCALSRHGKEQSAEIEYVGGSDNPSTWRAIKALEHILLCARKADA